MAGSCTVHHPCAAEACLGADVIGLEIYMMDSRTLPWEYAIAIVARVTDEEDTLQNAQRSVRYEMSGETYFGCILRNLQSNTSLRQLELSYAKSYEDSFLRIMHALEGNKTLEKFRMSSFFNIPLFTDIMVSALISMTGLTEIHLLYVRDANVGEDKILRLVAEQKTFVRLTLEYVRSEYTENKSFAAILQVLADRPTLESFSLVEVADSALFVRGVAHMLEANPALRTLNLCRTKLTDASLLTLVEALRMNTVLTSLDLSYNTLGICAAKALEACLATNTTLTKLTLKNTLSNDETCMAICRLLQTNTGLRRLDLSNNDMAAETTRVLVESMADNCTLTHLRLWGCNMGTAGAVWMARLVGMKTALTELDLKSNRYTPEDMLRIADAMEGNRTLILLHIEEYLGTREAMVKVFPWMRRNISLRVYGQTLAEATVACIIRHDIPWKNAILPEYTKHCIDDMQDYRALLQFVHDTY